MMESMDWIGLTQYMWQNLWPAMDCYDIHGGIHGLKWIEATYLPASMDWSGLIQCMRQNPWIGVD
jgi:hypothetical protein